MVLAMMPSAHAQAHFGDARVSVGAAPSTLIVEPSGQRHANVTVHAAVTCLPGLARPDPVQWEVVPEGSASGPTMWSVSTTQGQAPWTAGEGVGEWVIDRQVPIRIDIEQAPRGGDSLSLQLRVPGDLVEGCSLSGARWSQATGVLGVQVLSVQDAHRLRHTSHTHVPSGEGTEVSAEPPSEAASSRLVPGDAPVVEHAIPPEAVVLPLIMVPIVGALLARHGHRRRP